MPVKQNLTRVMKGLHASWSWLLLVGLSTALRGSLATSLTTDNKTSMTKHHQSQQQDPLARAKALVAQMTLAEQISLCQGSKGTTTRQQGYVGLVKGISRLGVPDLLMNDGPQGFRDTHHPGTSTQWLSGQTIARTWNVSAVHSWAEAMGKEFYEKGATVQFGPAVNVARIPNGGRSFEYLSGEDPYLGYTLVQPAVAGIQSQGVIANVKHFLDNSQEGLIPVNSTEKYGAGDRHYTSAQVDERTNMELYVPPFEGAIHANVLSCMCSNNLINGHYACESKEAMTAILRAYNPFKGFACSDYDGTRSTIAAANNGLDIAMPGPSLRPDFFGTFLAEAVRNGSVPVEKVVQKAVRIVYTLAVIGALDRPNNFTTDNDVTSPQHRQLAMELAVQSATLLINRESFLPLALSNFQKSKKSSSLDQPQQPPKIAVIGEAAFADAAIYGGGGSGAVVSKQAVSILQAMQAAVGGSNVLSARNASTATHVAAAADVAVVVLAQSSHEGADRTSLYLNQDALVAQTAAANNNTVVVAISPGPFLSDWRNHEGVKAVIDMGFPGEQEGNAFVRLLFALDGANFGGKLPHSLPNLWNETRMPFASYPGTPAANTTSITAASASTATVTASQNGGEQDARWKKETKLDGRELSKERVKKEKSGKEKEEKEEEDDVPLCTDKPLSDPGGEGCVCRPTKALYSEQLLTGYRWYHAHKIAPAFHFGHGLSYTRFSFSNLTISLPSLPLGRASLKNAAAYSPLTRTPADSDSTDSESDSTDSTAALADDCSSVANGDTCVVISASVTNTGSVEGSEVAQLYLTLPESAQEPFPQLRGFSKVHLKKNETVQVVFRVTKRWLSIWNTDSHDWTLVKGKFEVGVGASIGDVFLEGTFVI